MVSARGHAAAWILLVGCSAACGHRGASPGLPVEVQAAPRPGASTDAATSLASAGIAAASVTASSSASEASSASGARGVPDAGAAPFGEPVPIARYTCPSLRRGGAFHSYLAAADTATAFVRGDEWLALVNRSPTGALAPDYAPDDLVDLKDGSPRKPAECEGRECLRKDAADAVAEMLRAMADEGVPARVQSAFRGFGTQCWVFAGWARQARGGFCEATEQSALPGHSQHQLGTTLDLFTKEWAAEGDRTGQGVFRNGFGCTRGGRWLDENAWKFGFVVSYPIDPDDRKDGSRCQAKSDRTVPIDPKTGYKHEPWHLRFLGTDAAAKFHDAWQASGPGTPREITLEQWLRAQRGLAGDAELPVCDGCQCGACATLSTDDARAPCGKASLVLGADGRVVAPAESPRLVAARAVREGATSIVEVEVDAPAHTPTQTPVFGSDGPRYAPGSSYEALVPYEGAAPHAYPDLPGAYRVAIEPAGESTVGVPTPWPWRVSIAAPALAATWNRANVVLPAKADAATVRVRIDVPNGVDRLHVTLLRDGIPHGNIDVSWPP
jgi:D-alanyl-D-alanine carboxypeptidase